MNQTTILPSFRKMILASLKELSNNKLYKKGVPTNTIRKYMISRFELPETRRTLNSFRTNFTKLLSKNRIVFTYLNNKNLYNLASPIKKRSKKVVKQRLIDNLINTTTKRKSLKLKKKKSLINKGLSSPKRSSVSTSELRSCELWKPIVTGFSRRERKHNISNIFLPNNLPNQNCVDLYSDAARYFYR